MMAGPKVTIAPPERKPRKGGIKSVVGEFSSTPHLAVAEALQWVSAGCEFPKLAPGLCYAPDPVTGNKTFNGIDVGSGPIFALYQGVRCYLGNNTDYDARSRALLEEGEARGVEEALWEWATTQAVPEATATLVDAIAKADETADTLYLGQPVLLMSRRVAVWARAAKALFGDEESGRLWTANGTPVIATGAASDTQLFVLGWPTVYASDFVTVRTPDPTVNLEMALSERVYGIAVDCEWVFSLAVTAPAGTTDPGGSDELELTIGTEPASPVPDGTDVTVTVHANTAPTNEVHLWYRINGGAWTDNGEMTETDPTTFVENLDGTLANPGDVFDLYAQSGSTVSPTITINVT